MSAMTIPTLLIGQAPSRGSNPVRPFSGRSGATLAMLAGLVDLVDGFDVANVLDAYPGRAPSGKGDRFPLAAARRAAANLAPRLADRRVVFVGRGVATAFGVPDLAPLRWRCAAIVDRTGARHVARVAYLPHPSGVNLWWNDRRNVRRARRFLKRWSIP